MSSNTPPNETAAEKAARELEEKEREGKEKESQENKENEEENQENEENLEDEEDEEESEESESALRLYRALNDPNMGPALIQHLASQRGINLKDSTRSEQKDAIEQIEDLVKAELGPEFSVFGSKLSNILKKIVPAIAEQRVKVTEDRYAEAERTRLAQQVATAMNETFDSYQLVPSSVKKAMSRLMDEMPPIPGKTDPKKYFARMIKFAAEEVGVTLKSKSGNSENNADKSERNKRDASGRLASDRSSEVRTSKSGAPKQFKDRRSAIDQAMKDVEKQIESGKLKTP